MRIRILARLVLPLAAFKIAAMLLGLVCYRTVPYGLHLAHVLLFGSAALLLFITGADDPRATSLGGFFLVVAAAFCRGSLGAIADLAHGSLLDLVRAADTLKLDCFLPLFLWLFARSFPEVPVPRRLRRWIAMGINAAAWTGGILFGANLVAVLALRESPLAYSSFFLSPEGSLYYFLVILLLAPPLPILVYKARLTAGAEARRVHLFANALAATVGPVLLELLAEVLIPSYGQALKSDAELHRRMNQVAGAFFLPLPVITAYAVLVKRVLPVKLMARRALQYALARYSTFALAAVPLALLGGYVYSHKGDRIEQFFTGPRQLLLWGSALLAFAALRYRERLLESIDRRFFREQYDARQILTRVVQRIRGTHDVRELADLICLGIDRALHLQAIGMLVEDPRSGNLVDPRSRSRKLDASSELVKRIASATDPLHVDLLSPRSPLAKLPEGDRNWLRDSGFRLLVPIVARDGSLLGLIGMGEKKSGLPFLKEDRKLLVVIANSAALGVELELKATWGSSRGSEDESLPRLFPEPPSARAPENAKECLSCGALYLPYVVFCGNCSRRLEPSVVPYVLPGRFRFEHRLGAGGMGVVYRGVDLGLGRAVAVKTLKRVSPEDAMRLRREARTAAAVSHRHLAGVYGLEAWQGTPLLVMELMEGGTLTQRIEKGPLSAWETVELGIAMAEALEHLHAADILHRDVKPSNIGYTKSGVPKLMDFGIARVLLDLRPESSEAADGFDDEDSETVLPPTALWDQTPTSVTLSRQLVGTLSYLSPEALSSEPPNTSFDLWALAVVLYECVLGRKLFAGMDMKQTMTRIRQGRVPDYEQTRPDLDPALGEFFRSALHRTPARRPATAEELRQRLEAVREKLTEPRPGG